jgi:hypothetical protein
MVQNPLQQYIAMVHDWVAKARTETLWDQLPELYPAAQAMAQLAEDIVVWLDFKGYDGDAHYFLEHVGQCNEAMLRIYMWAKYYPEYLPKDNPSCQDALKHVLSYVHMDVKNTQWLDDQLPKEMWDGFDSH